MQFITIRIKMKNHWLEKKKEKEAAVREVIALDPDFFVPRKNLLTRYSKKVIKDIEDARNKVRPVQ